MSSAVHQVQSATRADLMAIRALLRSAELPTEDLHESAGARFWVVRHGSKLTGAIGLERFGAAGLLRSLVVDPSHRSAGIGVQLVRALESDAAAARVMQLVLLTQTAQSFFERLGYGVIDRALAPEAVRTSSEFRSLCPASAVCMTKTLELSAKAPNE
jgi:amino-acid N-acetyltransferase